MIQSTDAIILLVTGHMFETLFTWDGEYLPVPLLAESHEVRSDGLLITLRIRAGVPFHDGQILRASDVIASIERWGRVTGTGGTVFEHIDEIVRTDDQTIEFHMKQPYGTFAVALARGLQGCAIHPASVVDRSDDNTLAELIGTGPYRFVEWQPDRHIRLERFPDYASPGGEPDGYAGGREQYLDGIEFVPVRNEASRLAGLQAGDYHFLETVSPDHYPTLVGDPNVTVDLLSPDSWLNVVLNLRSPVLKDLDVRRAIQLALDHEPIMQAAFGEGFYELTPTLLPGADAWISDAGAEYFNQYRPEVARQLLADAGYDGTPLRIMTTQEIQQEYNGTLVMAQQLESVGFVVDLRVLDGATLSSARNDDTRWDMYSAWASFRPDPTMRNLTARATGWWEDEAKDRLLASLGAETDFKKRFALWEQVQQLFYEQVPRLKIGDSRRILVHSPKLNGIGPDELQPDFSNAWLEE
jgi:peptide/nickel transport system substrate-binding protein